MFARHPLERSGGGLDAGGLADAVRLALIAELDAVSFYRQVAEAARRAGREDVARVFEDVAREEMTHMGEFLELLRRLDPAHAEELEKGAEEVRELLG